MNVIVMTAIPITFHSVSSAGGVVGASATYPISMDALENVTVAGSVKLADVVTNRVVGAGGEDERAGAAVVTVVVTMALVICSLVLSVWRTMVVVGVVWSALVPSEVIIGRIPSPPPSKPSKSRGAGEMVRGWYKGWLVTSHPKKAE